MKLEVNQSKSFKICSKEFWNDTGLEINSGEEYKFVAEGTWKDLLMKCDADGYTSLYMSLYNRWKRSKDNNWFALIGSINQTSDFLIGKSNQKKINENGKLFCYANDVKGFYWNNFGEISLTITRIK
ncbi:MAG: hypothetical protein IT272_13685 [Chitinophagales bacterium]|nr:hypothetical protein [Chitinophagales bacterium]